MKRKSFVIPVLFGLLAMQPVSFLGQTATPAVTEATDTEEDTPAKLATEFDNQMLVQKSEDGNYQWYKYKAKKKGLYCLLLGRYSNAKVKITADGDTPVSEIADVELTVNPVLDSKVTPSIRIAAGEYFYFGVKSDKNEGATCSFEEETLSYSFGEPSVAPANGTEIESFAGISITYPDAQTNDEDAVIGLYNGDPDTQMSYIPAALYEGKLEATYGTDPASQAFLYLKQDPNGKPELQFSFDYTVEPDAWYTIEIPHNVLAFCTEIIPGLLRPIEGVPQSTGFLLHYKGKGLPKLNLTGCGIHDKDTLSHLGMIPFWFDKEVQAAEGMQAELHAKDQTVKTAALEILNKNGQSIVWADFTDEAHAPFTLEDSTDYTLLLPAGSLSTADGSLKSEELSIAFSGPIYKADTVEVPVEVPVEPEMTTVTYKIGDYVASVFKTPKAKSITVDLTPEDGWKVTGLMLNDLNVLPDYKEPTYTSPALLWDEVTLAATLAYEGFTYTEDANGIASVEGSKLKAYSQDGKIIVTGIPSGETVKVYSLGGSLLGTYTATEDKSEITVPTGKVYIVKVGSHALKLTNR